MNEAVGFLNNTLIPLAAHDVDKMTSLSWQVGHIGFGHFQYSIGRLLHQHGVNCRLLGSVRAQCRTVPGQMILAVEMVARTLKRRLRYQMRQKMADFKFPSETPYLDLFHGYINTFILRANQCQIAPHVGNYYKVDPAQFSQVWEFFFDDAAFGVNPARPDVREKALVLIVDRVITALGVRLAEPFVTAWMTTKGKMELCRSGIPKPAIEKFGEVIKHMNIISHAEGYTLKQYSFYDISMQKRVIQRFEEALNSSPLNKVTLRNLAVEYQNMWSRQEEGLDRINKGPGQPERQKKKLTTPQKQYIQHLYQLAVDSDPKDTNTLYQVAEYHLEHTGDLDACEDHFLLALIADVKHLQAYRDYDLLLTERMHLKAESDGLRKFYYDWATARGLDIHDRSAASAPQQQFYQNN